MDPVFVHISAARTGYHRLVNYKEKFISHSSGGQEWLHLTRALGLPHHTTKGIAWQEGIHGWEEGARFHLLSGTHPYHNQTKVVMTTATKPRSSWWHFPQSSRTLMTNHLFTEHGYYGNQIPTQLSKDTFKLQKITFLKSGNLIPLFIHLKGTRWYYTFHIRSLQKRW